MAWTAVGSLGTANSKTAGTTVVITTTATVEVGNVIIVNTAWDADDSSDGDTTHLSVTDSAGNTYVRQKEHTNGNGADEGVTVACFCAHVGTQLSSGGTITVTNDTSQTAKAAQAFEFTIASGSVVSIAGTAAVVNDAADPGDITVSGLASRGYLWLWALGAEGPQADAYTTDADYSNMGGDGTTGAPAASNMHLRARYRIFTGTSDTVGTTSDTADRDYAQVLVALLEAPLEPTGIASAEAFGTLALLQSITAAAIASAEAHGSPSLNQEVQAQAIASLETFGSTTLNLEVVPSSIGSAEAFGSALLHQQILPASIASAEAFGSHIVSVSGADQTILPTSIASAEAFGTAALHQAISTSGIPSAEGFGSLSLNQQILGAGAINSLEGFGVAALDVSIAVPAITSLEAFGTLTLQLELRPSAIGSLEGFGVATITGGGPVVEVGHLEHTEAVPLAQLRTAEAIGQVRSALSVGNNRISEEAL